MTPLRSFVTKRQPASTWWLSGCALTHTNTHSSNLHTHSALNGGKSGNPPTSYLAWKMLNCYTCGGHGVRFSSCQIPLRGRWGLRKLLHSTAHSQNVATTVIRTPSPFNQYRIANDLSVTNLPKGAPCHSCLTSKTISYSCGSIIYNIMMMMADGEFLPNSH